MLDDQQRRYEEVLAEVDGFERIIAELERDQRARIRSIQRIESAAIGSTFQWLIERGSTRLRLLGNIGWGRSGWPSEEDTSTLRAK